MTARIRRLADLVLASAVAAAPTTCSVPARAADPEIPLAAAESGIRDAGWIRATCSGYTTDQRCHLRFPEGFRRLAVTYVHGGDDLGTITTYDHDIPGRVRDQVRRFERRVVSGVRVSCSTTGAVAECTVRIRETVRLYEDTYWSAGWDMGGLIYDADGVPSTDIVIS